MTNSATDASTEIPLEALISEWLTFPDIAERLDVVVTKVHNMVKDRRLIAVKVTDRQIRSVPAELLTETGLVESLQGTVMVLEDAGFDDEATLRWLFTEDPSLPGRPIDALKDGRKTEIRRRAQAMAW
ncbi:Rv2175c family DNA-binding protein [Citricoccus muralis]|uniref:Rv2175c family DNA-binding protein n=1 Tax=Citricoccus muralis TaxID=169134 RepID=A0ABY8H310_9MICC|nr:Rv2175c family DNA-binding protein [Citricoccus muralis]WFP15516.1 Rv2175c family DNA-binding protein [Citricoccus muralis]